MKIKLLLILSLIAQSGLADVAPNTDVGDKLGERLGYGVGEHYFNNSEFNEKKPLKLLTKLVKGPDAYELTLSSDRVFNITSTPTSERKISIKFKLRHTSEKYLVDIAYIDKNEVIVAVTHPPCGYEFIKFKLVKNKYVPYLQSEIIFVPGLESTKPNKAKEVGFDAEGSFIIKRGNGDNDKYTIPENKELMLRNNQPYDVSLIRRFDDLLPEYLRIE